MDTTKKFGDGYGNTYATQAEASRAWEAKNAPPSVSSIPSTNPIIKNQSNLVQSTATETSRQNTAVAGIDNAVNTMAGTAKFGPNGEYTYKVDSKGVPYGDPINTQTPPNPAGGGSSAVPNANPNTVNTAQVGNVKDSVGNSYFSSMPKDLTYQLPALSNTSKWVFDDQGKPFEMDSAGTIKTNPVAEQQYNTNIQKNKEIETQNKMYESLKANVSMAHQVLIDTIKQRAQEQKTQMEDLNKKMLGSKRAAGFRTGGTEYTPEIYMGILKNEEEEGIRRIKDIDDKMVLALAEAVTAKNQQELSVAKEKFDTYSKLQTAKENAILNQYKMYIDNQKYISDTIKALEVENRAKQDQSIQVLKSSADGYVKGYASAPDKNAYVQSIATKLGLDEDIVLGQILNATPKSSTTVNKTTVTEQKASAIGSMATGMASVAGPDGYIDPNKWIEARKAWLAKGLNDADFLKNFKQYLNPESYALIPEFAPKKSTSSSRSS